jgi:hypothetical protein
MPSRQDLAAHLWTGIINPHLREAGLDSIIAYCACRPDAPFGDTGPAIERLLAAGASRRDLCLLMRSVAYEAVFGTLYAINDPGVEDNDVFMLHEELLGADPSGIDGRPGSADMAK